MATSRVALTIGNFDGVHRGHQTMLVRLVEAADDLALPAAVLTFEPHPRSVFLPATEPFRLTPFRAKEHELARLRQSLTSTYVPLDPILPREGRHVARWRLQVNISPEELEGVRAS